MTIPIYIQRRRTKGFNLQEVSMAMNGLPAVYVGRPGPCGNPYRIGSEAYLGYDIGIIVISTLEQAILAYYLYLPKIQSYLPDLKGKNLSCWCSSAPRIPCHAKLLLPTVNLKPLPKLVARWLEVARTQSRVC